MVGIICIRKAEQEDCCNFKASIGYKLISKTKAVAGEMAQRINCLS